MKLAPRTVCVLLAGAVALSSGIGLAAAALAASLPLPTTLDDYFQPGTQPLGLLQAIQDSSNCSPCHGNYDPDQEPYTRWSASMMAQSGRDPIFYAALAIAEQDASFSGDLCLRCHAPGAWLDGRSTPTDGSGLIPALGDLDGVTCHVCHRLVDTVYDEENPPVDKRILGALDDVPLTPGNGQYVVDPEDTRRGPFDLGPSFFMHAWAESPFHQESALCATCHDVSNPVLLKQPDGSYALDALATPHPTQSKYDQFPVERTFSEWSRSAFARRPIEMNGRFGGNKTAVSSCQDCHMPDTSGTACQPVLGGEFRDDLPLHDFNGANSWVLNAVRALYPDSETGLTNASVAAALARTQALLSNAADLELDVAGNDLVVRVVNQTGHKLPTGYPEGRRMWLNVRFYDASNVLLVERGHYDPTTADLVTGDTKVYEAELGIDAAQSAVTGLPAGPSFHFVLNNKIEKDNRIPPRGFTNAGFAAVQAEPVAATYAEERYWDDSTFALPAGTDRVEVRLYHQTTSKEYIEFLRNENTTNNAGQVAYDQWVLHGKSAPVLMLQETLDVGAPSCFAPVAYGLAKADSFDNFPRLTPRGSPSLAAGDFQVVVEDGLAHRFGYLLASAGPASQPFQGGFLLLASPTTRVASFQLDAQGKAAIAIPITPAMVGTERNYQAFYRDQGTNGELAMTHALHVDFCE